MHKAANTVWLLILTGLIYMCVCWYVCIYIYMQLTETKSKCRHIDTHKHTIQHLNTAIDLGSVIEGTKDMTRTGLHELS